MGPNTLSGHLSVIYTTECQIGFIIRAVRPILAGLDSNRLIGREYPDSVAATDIAERRDVRYVDEKAAKLVWASGCSSWFIDENTGRNTIMYPDYQFKFWLRTIFIRWEDLTYKNGSKEYRDKGEAALWVGILFGFLAGPPVYLV
jgi:hypothetical protein